MNKEMNMYKIMEELENPKKYISFKDENIFLNLENFKSVINDNDNMIKRTLKTKNNVEIVKNFVK